MSIDGPSMRWEMAEAAMEEDPARCYAETPYIPSQRCPLCGLFRAKDARAKWRCVNEIYIHWVGMWEHR